MATDGGKASAITHKPHRLGLQPRTLPVSQPSLNAGGAMPGRG